MARSQAISIDDQGLTTADPIARFLAGDLRDPETDTPSPTPIQSLVIAPRLDGCERDLLGNIAFPKAATIVCDPRTYEVLGERVAKSVPEAATTVIDDPKADEATAKALADRTRHADALIAVGAGTINDLVKYVSHRRGQPYVVFATAPSMNGYVTTTASLSLGDEKRTLPATPPAGAFFDLTILANAPDRLIRAGVGDSLCRTTAEIDWQLSHQLFDTLFLETPFAIQMADETELLARLPDLQVRDLDAINALIRLLVLGGIGMLIAKSSQPGSQGEHLISHYIDMLHRPHPGSLHGEQVGLATRIMAALQHHVLSRSNPPVLRETIFDDESLMKRFGRAQPSARAAMSKKALTGGALGRMNTRLEARWSALQATFDARALKRETLEAAFDNTGVAADPKDLGLEPAFYREAVLHARELRDRFTMLDLAADSGLLRPFVDLYLSA